MMHFCIDRAGLMAAACPERGRGVAFPGKRISVPFCPSRPNAAPPRLAAARPRPQGNAGGRRGREERRGGCAGSAERKGIAETRAGDMQRRGSARGMRGKGTRNARRPQNVQEPARETEKMCSAKKRKEGADEGAERPRRGMGKSEDNAGTPAEVREEIRSPRVHGEKCERAGE